jgi:DNA-binding NarL/FixJ family response regulator
MDFSAKKLPNQPTQVFLLIENRLVRETLARLFRKRLDMRVVGEAAPAETPAAASLGDIVVLNDLQAAAALGARLQAEPPPTCAPGLVLIGMEEDEEQFLAAARCGVSAFLLNDASAGEIVAAVCSVARGEAVCPPRLCLALIRLVAQSAVGTPFPRKRRASRGLTIRQQQLVSLVAKGLTNKQIAAQLNLSEFTIKNHIHRIMKQVEAENRHEAVEAARASGFLAQA